MVTITQRSGDPVNFGGTVRYSTLTIALDSSYPAGGESITPSSLGFSQFDVVMAEPSLGYTFEYDHTNNKLKAFKNAPAVVIEEAHTVTSKLITLDYPPAWIMGVSTLSTGMIQVKSGTASGNVGALEWGLTTAIVDATRSSIRFNSAQSGATVYVTYATQAWAELYDLLVQNEAIVAVAAGVTPANTIMGVGYVALATGTSLVPSTDADTPASGEYGYDMNTKTGALTFNAAQSGTTYYFTYLKAPTSGTWLADRYVSDEDTTTGGATSFDKPMICWLISGYGCTSGATPNKLITRDGAIASKTFKIMWGENLATANTTGRADMGTRVRGGGAVSGMIDEGAYISGHFFEIPTVPLEVPNGTDLSNVSELRVAVWGR